MIADGRKNIFSDGWRNLRCSGALPPGADFCAVDHYHRRLVRAEVGKLGRARCCWRPRLRQGWRRNEDQTPADPCVSKDFALAHRKKAASTEIRTSSRTRRKDGKQR